jgi:prepilin-type processing-associated H-X9-DG protein
MRQTKWADVIVSALLMLFLGTITIAQIVENQEIARRVKCASNLRQIGQAILLYSNENRGAYPRTIADMNNPAPTWGTPYEGNDKLKASDKPEQADPFDGKKSTVAVKPNDVTAALFLLLRTQDITSEVFICPSTGMEKWDYGGGNRTPLHSTNWHGNKSLAEHLSYSYQNPYPSKEAVAKGFKLNNAIGAEFTIAADMNPGVDALLKLTPAAIEEMQLGNSVNHFGEGQNVLYGDGHVEFQTSPFVGVNKDNIYTYGDSGGNRKANDKGGDGIVGPSVGPEDSILLPTSKDLGVVDATGKLTEAAQKRRIAGGAAPVAPGTPQEQAATKQAIQGTFVRAAGARAVTLEITADSISAKQGPMTIAFSYTAPAVGKDIANLILTAPDTPPAKATIKVEPDGSVTLRGNQYFEGTWKKK